MSFDDLGANVGVAIIWASQLIVHTQTKLPQQSVEHLQHCGSYIYKQWVIKNQSTFKLNTWWSHLNPFTRCQSGMCACMYIKLTYRTTGCNGSCLQQHFHYPSTHFGWVLAVSIQVAEKLLDYQVRVLWLWKSREGRNVLNQIKKEKHDQKEETSFLPTLLNCSKLFNQAEN